MTVATTSFYSFVRINDTLDAQAKVLKMCNDAGLLGTILIAPEGFNGYLSGDESVIRKVVNDIVNFTGATEYMFKVNYVDEHPFSKMKVRLKKEIVAMGAGDIDVNGLKGEYINSEDWDEFIARDDVIVIDTRNHYEVVVGTFEHSIDPMTRTFKEFPDWVKNNMELFEGKKIAMCCTGGVRCEKSTAYMRTLGFNEVYHLKGGILQYFADTKNSGGKWKGDCFVFDDRFAVDDALAPVANAPDTSILDYKMCAVRV